MKNTAETILIDQEQQINHMQQLIKKSLTENNHLRINHFIAEKLINKKVTNPLADRFEQLITIYEDMKSTGSRNFDYLLKEYLEIVNSGNIIKDLENAVSKEIEDMKEEYNSFLQNSSLNSPYPEMIERYKVSDSIFDLYKSILNDSLSDLMELLIAHHRNLGNFVSKYNSFSIRNKKMKDKKVVASIVANMLFGPLGSITSKQIFYNVEREDALESSMALTDVRLSWTRVETESLAALEYKYASALKLIYLSLFGGALVRIQNDLQLFGYEIKDFRFWEETATFQLIDTKMSELKKWFKEKSSCIDEKIRANKLEEAETIHQQMSSFVNSNDIIRNCTLETETRGMHTKLSLSEAMHYQLFKLRAEFLKTQTDKDKFETIIEVIKITNVDMRKCDAQVFEKALIMALTELQTESDQLKLYEALKVHIGNTRHTELYKDCLVVENQAGEDIHTQIFYLLNRYLVSKSIVNEIIELNEEFKPKESLKKMLEKSILSDTLEREFSFKRPFRFNILRLLSSKKSAEIELHVTDNEYLGVKSLLKDGKKPYQYEVSKSVANESYFMTKLLLDYGADPDKADDVDPPIIFAVEKDNYKIIDLLIKSNANSNVTGKESPMPISSAILNYDHHMVELLLQKPIDPTIRDFSGMHPALLSLYTADEKLIQLFSSQELDVNDQYPAFRGLFSYREGYLISKALSFGFSPNYINESGKTLLSEVSARYSIELLDALIEAGAKPEMQNSDLMNAVQNAIDLGIIPVAEYFIDEKGYGKIAEGFDEDDLEEAITNFSFGKVYLLNKYYPELKSYSEQAFAEEVEDSENERAKFLAKTGINVDIPIGEDEVSPLLVYIMRNEIHMVEAMLKAGANPDALYFDNTTSPLKLAIEQESKEIVELLLEFGANPNQLIPELETKELDYVEVDHFSYAVMIGNLEVINTFLKYNVDFNLKLQYKTKNSESKNYYTSLDYCVVGNNLETTEKLLASGAMFNEKLSSLAIAIESNSTTEIAILLIKNGVNVNQYYYEDDYEGTYEEITPLMLAVLLEKKEFVKLLLKSGADIHLRTASGKSAKDFTKSKEIKGLLNQVPLSETF